MENYSNQIANLFVNEFKLKKGDCVALLMENCPEYAGIWLGLSKLGVITALINTNLKHTQLLHSINVAKAKYVVYGSSLSSSVETIREELTKDIGLIVNREGADQDSDCNSFDLKSSLKAVSDQRPIHNDSIDEQGRNIFFLFKKKPINVKTQDI